MERRVEEEAGDEGRRRREEERRRPRVCEFEGCDEEFVQGTPC